MAATTSERGEANLDVSLRKAVVFAGVGDEDYALLKSVLQQRALNKDEVLFSRKTKRTQSLAYVQTALNEWDISLDDLDAVEVVHPEGLRRHHKTDRYR